MIAPSRRRRVYPASYQRVHPVMWRRKAAATAIITSTLAQTPRAMWRRKAAATPPAAPSRCDLPLLGIDDPQAFDNLENTLVRLSNVHVHPNVMLTGHHFSRPTRA